MNSNRAYEKLLDKIQNHLIELHKEINSLPDVNLFNLPLIVFNSILFPSQITELFHKLNQLRGKVKSALDTYTKTASREEDIEIQINPENESSINQGYLSRLMQLLEEIALLEDKLRRKSLPEFLGNTTEKSSGRKSSGKNRNDIDWDELDLKF